MNRSDEQMADDSVLSSISYMQTPARQHCCMLLDETNKDCYLLEQEVKYITHLEEEFVVKLDQFNKLSHASDIMLNNLWSLAEQWIYENKRTHIRKFVMRITKSLQQGDKSIIHEVCDAQLISNACPDRTLMCVLENILRSANKTKETFQTISSHHICLMQSIYLYQKIVSISVRLSESNQTYQYFLSMSKAIPYMNHVAEIVKTFMDHIMQSQNTTKPINFYYQYIPQYGTSSARINEQQMPSDLPAFSFLTKLITGELLDREEYLDTQPVVTEEILELETNKRCLAIQLNQHRCILHDLWNFSKNLQHVDVDKRVDSYPVIEDSAKMCTNIMQNNLIIWKNNAYSLPNPYVYHRPVPISVMYPRYSMFTGELPVNEDVYYKERSSQWQPKKYFIANTGHKLYEEPQVQLPFLINIANQGPVPNDDFDIRKRVIVSETLPLVKVVQPTRNTRRPTYRSRNSAPLMESSDLKPIKMPRLQGNLLLPLQ